MFAYTFAQETRKGNGLVDEDHNSRLINLTADIVSAHVANHSVAVSDVPVMIQAIHSALSGLGKAATVAEAPQPAVPVRASIKPEYIICLEDGRKLKTLKRHLMAHYGMTPADYRAKWGLPASYPMVAPRYAEARRTIAKAVGLGRRTAAAKEPAAQPAKAAAPKAAAVKRAVTRKAPATNEPADNQPAKAKDAVRTGRAKRGTVAAKA